MMPITDLMVEEVNLIIADAKQVVTGDEFLHRVAIFVPAGDNPVFPDAVVQLRTVKGSLERVQSVLEQGRKRVERVAAEVKIIRMALILSLKQEYDARFDQVSDSTNESFGKGTWFTRDDDGGWTLDLFALANTDLEAHFRKVLGD